MLIFFSIIIPSIEYTCTDMEQSICIVKYVSLVYDSDFTDGKECGDGNLNPNQTCQ